MALHGHTFYCIVGYVTVVPSAICPTRLSSERTETGANQCVKGGSGRTVGMDAVIAKLEKSMERSLVQGAKQRVTEVWGMWTCANRCSAYVVLSSARITTILSLLSPLLLKTEFSPSYNIRVICHFKCCISFQNPSWLVGVMHVYLWNDVKIQKC